jgi:putative acetyltransferase
MESTIVPFTIDLYDQVYELWRRCEGVGLSDADSRAAIARYLERNPDMSFVALEESTIIGTVLAGHDGRRGYIHHLAVDPNHRRKGVGHRLIRQCSRALQAEGILKCHLFLFRDNAEGMAFWEKIGWTVRRDIGVVSKNLPRTEMP